VTATGPLGAEYGTAYTYGDVFRRGAQSARELAWMLNL
jgi:hypothetical protein